MRKTEEVQRSGGEPCEKRKRCNEAAGNHVKNGREGFGSGIREADSDDRRFPDLRIYIL
jgi:hypothetical protein